MSTHRRQPAGTPVGGQFSAQDRPEAGVTLVRERPAPHPRVRSAAHARLDDLGVGAGKLALLAPVEATSVAEGLPQGCTHEQAVRAVGAYLAWRDLADTGPLHVQRAERIVREATAQYEASREAFGPEQAAFEADRSDPVAADRAQWAQDDLAAAVRRMDDAKADLRWLTDAAFRDGTSEPSESLSDFYARDSARRRFADPAYRGQLHCA